MGIVVLAYLAVCGLLYSKQRSVLYAPTDEFQHGFDTLSIESNGVQIKVIAVNPGHQSALLYFGGNAESVVHSAYGFKSVFPNRTLYFINYRGYGGSTGVPSERGLFKDAVTIFDQLSDNHSEVALIGRSLGSAVASYLASKRPAASLALITPFDSLQAVAQTLFPYFPMSILLKDKYDSISRASEITEDVLIVIAEDDEVIPSSNSLSLANAFAKKQLSLTTIEGAGHNNLSEFESYYSVLRQFVTLSRDRLSDDTNAKTRIH